MGIKGLHRELGQGKRVSLSKLAADSLESQNRPYRIAIDIAIWQFQTQAARGGTNPAIRTLFYRLVRLLGTPIQPIFVFDGPNKPVFKRGKRSGRGDGVATAMAKRLIRLFGFPIHDAPGEAEAECALLQQHGVVDAVLSDDVDTIMFGCTKTLRNWSSEGKTSKTPTHVSLYDVDDMALGDLGLDREGMVLVALMSGGDYLPDGIPGCGVKVACEAAKAGFGRSVCRLKASDKVGIQAWRQGLMHELHTNESGHFRTKHKALTIPQDFPNLDVLGYYTHPVVSPPESIMPSIQQRLEQKTPLQIEALREFTRETFNWDYRIGAIKFIRVLGQAVLVQKMSETVNGHHVKRISGRRTHFSTDGTPELRVAYIPEEVVPVDLAREADEVISYDRNGLALNSDEEFDGLDASEEVPASTPKLFDVTKPDLAWVLEGLVKKSASDAFQAWQDRQSFKMTPRSPAKKRAGAAKAATRKASDMPHGSLDRYVRTTKAPASEGQSQQTGLGRGTAPRTSSPSPVGAANPSIPSKQSSSSPARSPVKMPALQVIDSSPVPPRSLQAHKRPETIHIPSSPASRASPPPPLCSSPPRHASSRAPRRPQPAEMPRSIRSIIHAASSPQELSPAPPGQQPRPRRQPQPRPRLQQSPKAQPKSAAGLKQSSLDAFVGKPAAVPAAASPPGEGASSHLDSDSDLEPLSAILQKNPLKKQASSRNTPSSAENRSGGNTSLPRETAAKALISSDGIFDEARPDAEQGDGQSAAGGSRSTGVRWSDVSIIDLTADDR
ncbi:hypothetical protein UVI_02042280 [Ustilaginoidea virens]|uniref:Flap structure-specific endonuclease n=1 Tax=Ustilaginoidea virens TaxID=1159556 RepID=A0A1B5L7G2_USTVR|nr:hypothetical protein UVI_02042280 [Ustilaginoidea virens]